MQSVCTSFPVFATVFCHMTTLRELVAVDWKMTPPSRDIGFVLSFLLFRFCARSKVGPSFDVKNSHGGATSPDTRAGQHLANAAPRSADSARSL